MILFQELIEEIAQIVLPKNWLIATAESCTGGLLAASLTNIPGSSQWFDRGFVTYSNVSKIELLSVAESLISKFGAVSEEVAKAMALGALEHSAAQITVSVTGIAGPEGGSLAKPVGTVCFAWAIKNKRVYSLKKVFSGNRQTIRNSACEEALKGILSYLK